MATTSDGDPLDPSKVNTTINAQPTNTPVVHSATASSILTKIDGEPRYFMIVDDDDEDKADDDLTTHGSHDDDKTDPVLHDNKNMPEWDTNPWSTVSRKGKRIDATTGITDATKRPIPSTTRPPKTNATTISHDPGNGVPAPAPWDSSVWSLVPHKNTSQKSSDTDAKPPTLP